MWFSNQAWSEFRAEPQIELVRPAIQPQGRIVCQLWSHQNWHRLAHILGALQVPGLTFLKRDALTLRRTDRSDFFLKQKANWLYRQRSNQGMKAIWVQMSNMQFKDLSRNNFSEVVGGDHEKALLRRFLRKPLSLWRTAAQPLRQDQWYFLSLKLALILWHIGSSKSAGICLIRLQIFQHSTAFNRFMRLTTHAFLTRTGIWT